MESRCWLEPWLDLANYQTHSVQGAALQLVLQILTVGGRITNSRMDVPMMWAKTTSDFLETSKLNL